MSRRVNPDGHERMVSTGNRAGKRVQVYPWSEMLIGDFFVAPIKGSKSAMITTFRQAAARLDIEISIFPWVNDKGENCLRVCKIQGDIKKVKRRASKLLNKKLPVSDGKWKGARERRRLRAAGVEVDEPPIPITVPPSAITEPPVDVGAPEIAEVGYDRSERLRRAKEAARREMGLDEDEENYFEEVVE